MESWEAGLQTTYQCGWKRLMAGNFADNYVIAKVVPEDVHLARSDVQIELDFSL